MNTISETSGTIITYYVVEEYNYDSELEGKSEELDQEMESERGSEKKASKVTEDKKDEVEGDKDKNSNESDSGSGRKASERSKDKKANDTTTSSYQHSLAYFKECWEESGIAKLTKAKTLPVILRGV